MAKRSHARVTTEMHIPFPYLNLAADIIIDAIHIISGHVAATYREREEALEFIRSEKCQRWAAVIGIDLEVCLNHKDSVIKEMM